MGIPEFEGLSCCVGTIFGPLRKNSTCTSLQLNYKSDEIDDSHHNPYALPTNVKTTLVYPRSLVDQHRRRTSVRRNKSDISLRRDNCTTRKRVLVSPDKTLDPYLNSYFAYILTVGRKLRKGDIRCFFSRERDSTVDDEQRTTIQRVAISPITA